MNLEQLRVFLDQFPDDRKCSLGFQNPHSYRGYYDEVAFEYAINVTVGDMKKSVSRAFSETFQGWKGGDYEYGGNTPVHFATVGSVQYDDVETRLVVMQMLLCISGIGEFDLIED